MEVKTAEVGVRKLATPHFYEWEICYTEVGLLGLVDYVSRQV